MSLNVGIVIPAHNNFNLVKRCVESIQRKTNPITRWDLVVVDDASTEKNFRKNCRDLVGKMRNAKLVYFNKQKGFSEACLKGIGKLPKNERFYVFLNSDCEIITKDWLMKMTSMYLNSKGKISCIGPISNAAGWQSIPNPNPSDARVNDPPRGFSKNDIGYLVDKFATGEPILFPMIHGFCFLIENGVFRSVGGFDAVNFPHHGSEDDLMVKLHHRGISCAIADNVYIWHEKNQSYKESRKDFSKAAAIRLREIHGNIVDNLVAEYTKTPPLDALSQQIKAEMEGKTPLRTAPAEHKKRESLVKFAPKYVPTEHEKIGVGICTYYRPEQLTRLINSCRVHLAKQPHLLLCGVDDSRDQRSADVCETLSVKYYTATNRGNSVNRNRLMKVLYDQGCDYIFLLEDDIEVMGNFVTPYVTCMKSLKMPIMCGLHPLLLEQKGQEGHCFEVIQEQQCGKYTVVYPSGNSNIFIALHRDVLDQHGYIDTVAYKNRYARTTGLWLDKIKRRCCYEFPAWLDVKEGRECYIYRPNVAGGMSNEEKKKELKRFREFDLIHSGRRSNPVSYPEEKFETIGF